MRAPVFVLAIVICTVTALAVLSKSRAEEETSKDATLAPTAKSDSDTTTAIKPTDCEPKITAGDAEQIIAGIYDDDARIWGNNLTWKQLKATNQAQEMPSWVDQSTFFTVETRVSDVSTHPYANSQDDRLAAAKAYIDAARKLDEVANDLEEAKLFGDADQVRLMTTKLRARARLFPAVQEEQFKFIGGVGMFR